MMRRCKRVQPRQEGSVAIVVALALTAVMGLAALSTDVGRLYVERMRISTLTDAAALSGAQYLPSDPVQAEAVARSYLQKNGLDPVSAIILVSADQHQLSVQTSSLIDLTFARIIGQNSATIHGEAAAQNANLSGFFGAAPLGVARDNWQIGQQVTLKMDADGGAVSPGNYQALALGKSGASMYEQNLMYGYQAWIRLDQWVDTETGNMAGPTIRAVNYRIGLDPSATYTSYSRHSPRLVAVPVVEDFNVNGKGQVHVVGFGMFFLEGAVDKGSNKGEVLGRFVRYIAEGEGSAVAPDFGAHVIKLTN